MAEGVFKSLTPAALGMVAGGVIVLLAAASYFYPSAPPQVPSAPRPETLSDLPHKTLGFAMHAECRKKNARGCTARETEDFLAPPGTLIDKARTRISGESGLGINQSCKLDFNEAIELRLKKKHILFRKARLTAHAESGRGTTEIGKIFHMNCKASIYLVTPPS